jgi:hypothetical protein
MMSELANTTSSVAVPPSEERPRRVPPVPLILTVSCSAELLERCRIAAEPTDALVLECDESGARALSLRWRPLAIILDAELYQFHAKAYDKLARLCRAKLIIVDTDTVSVDHLKREIVRAVWAVYR